MSSIAEDLAQMLHDDGVGVLASISGWSIQIGEMPPAGTPGVPDTCIAVQDEPGGLPMAGLAIDEGFVSIVVRGDIEGKSAAISKTQEIKDSLHSRPVEVVNGATYSGLWVSSDYGIIGIDEGRQPVLRIQFRVIREPAGLGHRRAV